MEGQMLLNIVVGLAAFFGGWTLNSISRTLERLDNDVRDMPHMYVNREDYGLFYYCFIFCFYYFYI